MSNFKLILEYNGEAFSGSQIQNVKQSSAEIEDCEQSPRTVQGELEKALSIYFRSNISTDFSSRTDAGVHAIGQVVNFHLSGENFLQFQAPSLGKGTQTQQCKVFMEVFLKK